jgi:hypothetical protein
MPYITFQGKAPDSTDLSAVRVAVYDTSGQILADWEYGPYSPGESARTVELPAGDYRLWVRSSGYVFAWPTSLTVNPGDSDDEGNPTIVDLTASSTSARPGAQLPAQVYGFLSYIPPGGEMARLAGGHGHVTRGHYGPPQTAQPAVIFTKVGSAGGGPESLRPSETFSVYADANGRFEAQLEPESVYAVTMPNQQGQRYFTSPASGVSADLETLILADLSKAPYEFING